MLPKKLGSCGEWFEDPAEPLISECLPRVITVNISIPDQNVNGNKLTTARFEAAGIAVGAAEGLDAEEVWSQMVVPLVAAE